MFKFYTTFDIISEINVQIERCDHSVQVLVDKNDLFFLSDSLLELLDNNIEIEIIIVSETNQKSLKIINLCKRLIDGGVAVYWCTNSFFLNEDELFGIFDKTLLITTPNTDSENENIADFIRLKTTFFKSLALESEKLELLSGDINIEFSANNTIVEKNEPVELSWNIKNAYHVSITPFVGDVALIGSAIVNLKNDQKFVIKALNKETSISKIIFIKVLENKEICFNVCVFDTTLDQYIKIDSSTLNKGHYGVHYGQTVKVSWEIKMIGKLHENSLGVLPLVSFYECLILKDKQFFFTFTTIQNTQIEKIYFHSFDNSQIELKLEKPFREYTSNDLKKTNWFSNRIEVMKKFVKNVFK